jgi:protein SCO1/2
MERTSERRESGWIDGVDRFFGGGAFPAFGLSVLFFYEVLLVGLLVTPAEATGLGAFAEEFRVWCFGYDPATGRLDWSYVLGMTGPPVVVGAIFALLWWGPLRALLARPAAVIGPALVAALVVGGAAGAFAALGASPESADLPFPADALRTAHRPPELRLINQAGQAVDLAELRGHVVVLTAMYASCPHTCPLILAQTKRAIRALTPDELAGLRFVAVTMDPERDSPELLAQIAEIQSMETPLYNFVTGEPGEVERVLDDMGIARRRDPETGIIEHVSLFLLLDREGKVAYRLTLGDRQERWLVAALKLLLGEEADIG